MAESDLDYVKVIGRLGIVVGDGPDVGANPDVVTPDAGGTVTFTPLTDFVKIAGSIPPITLGASVITCTIDAAGYLTYNGQPFVWLTDLGSPKVNPTTALNVATYQVDFNVRVDGVRVDFPRFTCHPLPGVDNDLTVMAPVPTGNGTPIVVGPQGVGVSTLSIQSGRLIATLTNGATSDAGLLPVGPGGSDAGVAGYVNDPASQTKAALSASIDVQVGSYYSPSPRGGQRVKFERRAQFHVVKQFPNVLADHKILYVDDKIMFGWGHDFGLRKSTDGGATWAAKVATGGGTEVYGKGGLFFKTVSGVYITTSHPAGLTTGPKIIRSTDGGSVWSQVIAAQTNVDYLGPTSIVQDPVTGYLYLLEYVTVAAATQPTWRIMRCTDGNGANWTVFHTFQRDADANPTTAVRHGHCGQWDPIGLRVTFGCGDSEQSAGIYRVRDDGLDVEPIVTRAQILSNATPADDLVYAGAVGLMFFPNYIAWGIDQTSDSYLVRMNRNQLGAANPVVEVGKRIQSTAFYTARLTPDNTEWLMTTSDENGAGGSLDNGCHIYRVSNDGATIDELGAYATERTDSFSWMYPVGGNPLATLATELVWFGTNTPLYVDNLNPNIRGFQFAGRMLWSNGPAVALPKPTTYRPFYNPESVGWRGDLTASEKRIFGIEEVPIGPKKLYFLNTHREQFMGAGFFYLEAGTVTQGAFDQTLGAGLVLTASTDRITATAHGQANGTPVRFSLMTGGAGVVAGPVYYMVNVTANDFQVALSVGGLPIDIATDGSTTVKYDPLPVFAILKFADAITDAQWQHRSRRTTLQEATAPWLATTGLLTPGTKIAFRVNEVSAAPCGGVAGITYAWGF